MQPSIDDQQGPTDSKLYVAQSLTGDMLTKPFLLPGSIWQLMCFVARQHDSIKFNDVGRSVTILKRSKDSTNGEPSTVACGDWGEWVESAHFTYFFIFEADMASNMRPIRWLDGWVQYTRSGAHTFKPWRDMVSLASNVKIPTGDKLVWYYQRKDVLDAELSPYEFEPTAVEYYATSERHGLLRRDAPEACWAMGKACRLVRFLKSLKNVDPEVMHILSSRPFTHAEGNISNAQETWLCSGKDQVVEITTFDDGTHYHLCVTAFDIWVDVINGWVGNM